MSEMVCRVAPTRSARSVWERPSRVRASLIRRFFSSFTKCSAPFCTLTAMLRLNGASPDPSALIIPSGSLAIPSGSLATMLRLNGHSLGSLSRFLSNARYIFHLQIIYCISGLSRGEVTLGDKGSVLRRTKFRVVRHFLRPRVGLGGSCVKDD